MEKINPSPLTTTTSNNLTPSQYYGMDPSIGALLSYDDICSIGNHHELSFDGEFQDYQGYTWQIHDIGGPITTINNHSINTPNPNETTKKCIGSFTNQNNNEECIHSLPPLRTPRYPHQNSGNVITSASSQLPTKAPTISCSTMKTTLRKGTSLYRETHINSERQRRKTMSNLFNTLHSLLPVQLNFKVKISLSYA
mgnify:FL=1